MGYAISIPRAGSPEVLETVALDAPAAVPAGHALVRNRAAAVNFIDTIIRRGEMPAGAMPGFPHVPGVEGAGVVVAVGEGVARVRPGDRVAWMGPIGVGGYGTHSVVAEPYLAALADRVDFDEAAALSVNAVTAWHMLVNLGRVESGQTVLVRAAGGGVGTMAVQLARHLGLTVIGCAAADKLDHVRAQGAALALDRRSGNLVAETMAFTGGRGVDLTLNPVSGSTLRTDLEVLAPFGTAIVFGFLAGQPGRSLADTLANHFDRSIGVRMSDIYTYFHRAPQSFGADLARVHDLHAQGVLRPRIQARLPLDRAGEAHRLLEAGTVAGKLVLTIT